MQQDEKKLSDTMEVSKGYFIGLFSGSFMLMFLTYPGKTRYIGLILSLIIAFCGTLSVYLLRGNKPKHQIKSEK